MSSTSFSFLTNEFPEEREAVGRLAAVLQRAVERQEASSDGASSFEWTVQRLFDVSRPSSQRILARILTRLVEKGVLRQVFRVESVTRGGLGDYESILEIPTSLFDEFVGHEIDVSLDQIRTIYSLGTSVHA